MPNTFWQSTTTWYCFAFDRLLLTLATSVVSLTATIWHYQGIEMCKWYAACKKKKSPKASLRPKEIQCLPLSWALLILEGEFSSSLGLSLEAEIGSRSEQRLPAPSKAQVWQRPRQQAWQLGPMTEVERLELSEQPRWEIWQFCRWTRFETDILARRLDTERSSIKFLNKKSHNEINIAIRQECRPLQRCRISK